MSVTPTIHQSASELREEQLLKLPRQRFESDWFGKPLDFVAEFCLAVSPRGLFFLISANNSPKFSNHPLGQFTKGLWEEDVGELFISHSESSVYQEWNLSPSGAWWSQRFTEARKPDSQFAPDSAPSIKNHVHDDGWWSWIELPYNARLLEASRVDITMILTDPRGDRRFLSCCPEPGIAPNFHRPESYQTPKVISFS